MLLHAFVSLCLSPVLKLGEKKNILRDMFANILVQFSVSALHFFCCCLVVKSCLILHDPMDRSMPGPPVFHCLLEFSQIHDGRFGDTVQPSHPLSSPSHPAFTLSQYPGLFQGVYSSHEMAKGLEPQLQDLSFQ